MIERHVSGQYFKKIYQVVCYQFSFYVMGVFADHKHDIKHNVACVEDGCVERPRFAFDLGADYEAEGGHFGQGDGAVALAWPLGPDCDGTAEQPLSIQTPLEPVPPCNQVRRK